MGVSLGVLAPSDSVGRGKSAVWKWRVRVANSGEGGWGPKPAAAWLHS